MKEIVSIIIPVYNTAKFLPHCLDSLLAQTYKDIQIILVNDGSKDNSLEVMKEYANKDDRVKVITKENEGPSKTRNRGLDSKWANSLDCKYICFIDSDDYVSPVFVETLLTSLKQNDADISVTKDTRVSEKQDLEFTHTFDPNNYKKEIYDRVTAMQQLFSGKKFGVGPCNKLYKREVLNGEKPIRFPTTIYYSEDVPFVYDAFAKVNKVVYTPVANYAYTKRNGSQVRSKVNERKLTVLTAVQYCAEKCKEEIPDAYSYPAGWRVLVNFEILYYLFRDNYFVYEKFLETTAIMKRDMKHLTRSRRFPLYRRVLLPFGSWLLKTLFKIKYRKQIMAEKKKLK